VKTIRLGDIGREIKRIEIVPLEEPAESPITEPAAPVETPVKEPVPA
jgi:hypothetical protein